MPPLTHSCYDIMEAREWAGSTMDTLFSNDQPIEMDPAPHITLGKQQQPNMPHTPDQKQHKQQQKHLNDLKSTVQPRRASVLPHRLQRFNQIRRSFSVLDGGIHSHKKPAVTSPQQNKSTQQQQKETNQCHITTRPPHSFCLGDDDDDDDDDDDSSSSTTTPPTASILTCLTSGTQSAPVSPTDLPRRPSFSSRIIRKTFDMKSLFITTFDRQRKGKLEKEREALALWQHTFEQSLLESGHTSYSTSIMSSNNSSNTTPLPTLNTLFNLSSTTAVTTDLTLSLPLSSTPKHSKDKSSKYSRFIMMELLSTEENYLDGLYIIKTKFMDPLVEASQQPQPIINYRDIRTIFAFIPQLLLLSVTLVRRLRSAIDNSDQTIDTSAVNDEEGGTGGTREQDPCNVVACVLCDLESSFDIFLYYTLNFKKSRKCLNKLDCDALCHQLLQDPTIWRKETKRMNLSDFLITPIQRITRYCLILKDLQKHSPESTLLDRSIKCLSSLAFTMNEIQ